MLEAPNASSSHPSVYIPLRLDAGVVQPITPTLAQVAQFKAYSCGFYDLCALDVPFCLVLWFVTPSHTTLLARLRPSYHGTVVEIRAADIAVELEPQL